MTDISFENFVSKDNDTLKFDVLNSNTSFVSQEE